MTQWYFGGVNLDQISSGGRWAIEDLSSAQDMGIVRGDNPDVPFREGRTHVPKYYDQRIVSLGMVVSGKTKIEFESRMDSLKQLFGTRTQQTLKRKMADSSIRETQAEVWGTNKTGAMQFRHFHQDYAGKMVVDFLLGDPFFRTPTATAPGATTIDASPKAFEITNPGTGQDRSMIITLNGPLTNPRIDNLTNSVWLSWTGVIGNGAVLIVDVGEFETTLDGNNALDDFLHAGDPYAFVLNPGVNSISVTSDVTTTGDVGFSFNAPYF